MQIDKAKVGGLAGWLLQRFHARREGRPRLLLIERIALAPRQTLSLVEADGRRVLVATSADGAPSFLALVSLPSGARRSQAPRRVSW